MLESLRRFLTQAEPDDRGGGDDLHRLRVATSVLLLEAMNADDALDEAEWSLLNEIVATRFQLPPAAVADLLALADQQRRNAGDLYGFTRLINDHFTRPQKLAVVELLWRVVYSDGRLEAREDALLHRVANLLQLRQEELIALKLQVRDERNAGGG